MLKGYKFYSDDTNAEVKLINRIKENNFHIKAKNNELINFEIQGDGTQTRAFEHIDDFIDGIEILMKNGKDREIYNIGNDEEISINDLSAFKQQSFLLPLNRFFEKF